jgi:hypothetical protein
MKRKNDAIEAESVLDRHALGTSQSRDGKRVLASLSCNTEAKRRNELLKSSNSRLAQIDEDPADLNPARKAPGVITDSAE